MSSEAPKRLGSLTPRGELPRPPFFMIGAFLILTVATWIPLVVIARARVGHSTDSRLHLTQDMDAQPKLKTQQAAEIFADGRELRLPIEGTIARGHLDEDDHYFRGYRSVINPGTGKTEVTFFDGLPPQVQLTPALLKRGQERFEIYCGVCHGNDGYGNGPVNARAIQRQEAKWVPPANLHTDLVRGRPDGHIFNTITNGIRNMAAYGPQIPVEDRWAIVAYVRALELSQQTPARLLPAERVNELK